MTTYNKPIWTEGMFLRPHHFQVQDNYHEVQLSQRIKLLTDFFWGWRHLLIDKQMLALGKIVISAGEGIFPDGTYFNIEQAIEPVSFEVGSQLKSEILYLGIPMVTGNAVHVEENKSNRASSRYILKKENAADISGDVSNKADVSVGLLRFIILSKKDKQGYITLPLCKIEEVNVDNSVSLDSSFIPPVLDLNSDDSLQSYLTEIAGLLTHRTQAIAARLRDSSTKSTAEIADFLMLQILNRTKMSFDLMNSLEHVHPYEMYKACIGVAGEIATFTNEHKLPKFSPNYDHDQLMETYEPVMMALREGLSAVFEQGAVEIPLQQRKFGVKVAPIQDRSQIKHATFVIAVKAEMPSETVRNSFPSQVKIGPAEKIVQLVQLQLPGIALKALPVAPRKIPYNAGFIYFELDKQSAIWKDLFNSGGFAFHISGDLPGLEMEFWAIKQD